VKRKEVGQWPHGIMRIILGTRVAYFILIMVVYRIAYGDPFPTVSKSNT